MKVPPLHADMFMHVLGLEGRDVIYIQKSRVFHIRVSNVGACDNNQGFYALATPQPTIALPTMPKKWWFGAGWDYFFANSRTVKSTYGGWRVHHEPESLEKFFHLLKKIPEGRTYRIRYFDLDGEGNDIDGNEDRDMICASIRLNAFLGTLI